ncbi:hypothetical protein HU200_011601 [Digitaria exilis]|uniref:Endonuclease/exonuclease/phosphatase domain-containing protein n=1 Tax=Digitaria exilis TaxID=1010633 RepID=A0A835KMJ4_9POAL|nr:hypothetical protein HU200_011601 [Digitaria exilis]
MAVNFRSFKIASWNVRGLGQKDKCRDVKRALASCNVDVVALQETKLQDVPYFKGTSFLPRQNLDFKFKPSMGAAGGVLTAWSNASVDLISFVEDPFSVTASFCLRP